jgi:hypothetical protein
VNKTLFDPDCFLSHGNIVGVVIFTWGRIWGNNICRVVTKVEITVLGVPVLSVLAASDIVLTF